MPGTHIGFNADKTAVLQFELNEKIEHLEHCISFYVAVLQVKPVSLILEYYL